MPSRRCGICREVGHNRRNCPRSANANANHRRNQQYDRPCFICGIPGHDPSHCPMNGVDMNAALAANANDQEYIDVVFVESDEEGYDNLACALCESTQHEVWDCPIFQRRLDPQRNSTPMKKKIHWDKCGKCGTENTGNKFCVSCGEKQIIPVPKNEKGVHECIICYANLRELNKVTTKCGHHFCIDCFLSHHDSNQASSGDCPMCRAQILEVEVEEPDEITPHQERIIDTIRDLHRQLRILNM